MREQRGGLAVVVAMVVVVVVVVKGVNAIPTQPADSTLEPNHVEDQYLDDALGTWLDNFGTYTFMVKQGLDTHDDADEEDDDDGGHEVDIEAVDVAEGEEAVRKDEEEEGEEWSAPIAVFTGPKSLLDARRDYLVTVESLVAEEGSIFLTLSKYENQTTCGVGGLTQEDAAPAPRRTAAGSLDVAQATTGSHDQRTTFIAFGLQLLQEGDVPIPDTSQWVEVSEQYWWARGRLGGGGMLSITFTPPECGCLALSTYFALPVGNLTLVVGPQAYPDELQTLLCVDPLAAVSDDEYGHEEEEEEEEEEEDDDSQPSALARVASRNADEDKTETEAEESPQQPTVVPRKRKMSREEKKAAKKTRRQMKRQKIRQAGRWQARQQGAPGGRGVARRMNRKRNQRKRPKVWKKLHKRGKRGRRRFPGKHHHEGNETTAGNTTHHHHHRPGLNTSAANQQEERLVDILLRDLEWNRTSGEETAESDVTEDEDGVVVEEVEGEAGEYQTPRQRRKNRRQRNKQLRKQKRKIQPPGVKFCCKQGVKHKKNILELDSTTPGDAPGPCNVSSAVVSTFANHQFGIVEDTCTTTFATCCNRFTGEMWDGIKAKKAARREERKQRRMSRRKGRNQRRRQGRRLRKGMKRKPGAHHEDYEDPME